MKIPIMLGAAAILAAVVAEDLPFYKDGSAIPSYDPVSEAASAEAVPLDSRSRMAAVSEAIVFDSNEGFPGLMIIVK